MRSSGPEISRICTRLSLHQFEKINKLFELWGKNLEWSQPSSKYDDGDSADGESEPESTLLRVHMGYTYAAELSGAVKF